MKEGLSVSRHRSGLKSNHFGENTARRGHGVVTRSVQTEGAWVKRVAKVDKVVRNGHDGKDCGEVEHVQGEREVGGVVVLEELDSISSEK
jgi:hypothetical protein